jgi:hypothetical protein
MHLINTFATPGNGFLAFSLFRSCCPSLLLCSSFTYEMSAAIGQGGTSCLLATLQSDHFRDIPCFCERSCSLQTSYTILDQYDMDIVHPLKTEGRR